MSNKYKFKYKLGVTAKDMITGFKGIIVSRTQHVTGCDTYALKPIITSGNEIKDAEFFDENQLQMIDEGVSSSFNKKNKVKGSPIREHQKQ